jgi:hypothetical protein
VPKIYFEWDHRSTVDNGCNVSLLVGSDSLYATLRIVQEKTRNVVHVIRHIFLVKYVHSMEVQVLCPSAGDIRGLLFQTPLLFVQCDNTFESCVYFR